MNTQIYVSLAGLTFPCQLRYSETAQYFPKPDPAALRVGGDPVCLTDEDWQSYISFGMEDCARTEFSVLTAAFSDALMEYDRLIIHAAAVRWRDRAYLISAKSGVGKSTQVRCLQALRPGEFSVICGDRPALEIRPDGVLVHPSHWNGKENWYGAEAAFLGGIIVLERGKENQLQSIAPREAAIPVYEQVIQTTREAEKMRKAAELTTSLLKSAPIWKLTTFQAPDSTKLLLDSVFPDSATASEEDPSNGSEQ